ncbi:MAG: DinB family protein [Acidobacteriota bacterium]
MANGSTIRSSVRLALDRGPAPSFADLAARYLEEYLDKICATIDGLSHEQIWWRPTSDSNSIGNLLMHLAGNLRLWIGNHLGGGDFVRDRSGEFAADGELDAPQLVAGLAAAVEHCAAVLRALDDDSLETVTTVQGYTVDGLGIAFHATEHMSYHCGQIVQLAKQLRGEGHGIELYPQHSDE